jgi:two-component system, chemotaxis family, sensor kinase CheA
MMDELMQQFALEARELVQQAADDLMALERAPRDRPRLESAFRAIHTLKGSVGLFDFGPMHGVLHLAEDLLTAARNDTIDIDAGLIDPLIAVIEWVDRCVDDIVRDGLLSAALAGQAEALLALMRQDGEALDAPLTEVPEQDIPEWAVAILRDSGRVLEAGGGLVALRYEPHPECFFNGDDPLATLARVPEIVHLQIAPREPWPALGDFDPFRCNLTIEAIAAAPLADIEAVFRLIPDQVRLIDLTPSRAAEPVVHTAASAEHHPATMRVDAARIDALVEIAGELITAKNSLLPLADAAQRATGDERLSRQILASHQEIERLVGALYSAVTKARLIPLGHAFRRFPRLVRETAARLGKAVDLVIEGEAVEADREIVEDLFEPLLHLLRNALDHGIETEAERLAAGKPARATVTLRARQRGEQIEVELVDDGRGIVPGRIAEAAVSKGLLTATASAALSDAAALQLVFLPGFSTADSVSDLSGRGVGLDAVKSAVQRLGGKLELSSVLEVGTVFRLSLPVSFAMSRLMVVVAGGERFGIAIESIVETLRLSADAIMPLRAGEAFVLRDRTIPLLHLAELLQLPLAAGVAGDLRVLIVQAGAERIGIAVDAIAERAETLMRPLSGLLRGMPGIAGTTQLGDGRVLLVLDLEALIG